MSVSALGKLARGERGAATTVRTLNAIENALGPIPDEVYGHQRASQQTGPSKTGDAAGELILFNDAALRKKAALDGDAFALDRKLKPIYQAVLSPTTETPFSVMISGGWGTGKTSSMAWLDAYLRRHGDGEEGRAKVDTCWFYPWKYQDREDVWKGLIAEVILACIDFENVDTAKILEAARQFGKFLGGSFVRVLSSLKLSGGAKIPGVPKASVDLDLKEALTGIIEEYGKHVTPQDAYYNVFEKTLEGWITRCYDGDRRLVIFIDDLDRCLPAVALQVLEAMKLYLNIPNLVIIAGVDRQVIDAVVMKHYQNSLGDVAADDIRPKARQYLDKMFQVEVPIAPNNLQVRMYIAKRIEETSLWKLLDDPHPRMFEGIIREIADINPRSVVRALNTAIVGAESETEALPVAQSVQRALITTVLAKLPEGEFGPVHDLCLREQGREFFRRWSRHVVADPTKPNYLTEEELAELKSPAAPVPGEALSDEDFATSVGKRLRPTGDLAEEVSAEAARPLMQLANHYRECQVEGKAPTRPNYRRLLTVRILGLLMRVPFAEEEITDAGPVTDIAGAVGPDGLNWTPLIKLVAERLRVGVDQITPEFLKAEIELDFSSLRIPNAAWLLIGNLKCLESFNLNNTEVTDEGLGNLSSLLALKRLWLGNTRVTDEGLRHLKDLTKLQVLSLDGLPVTDAGLAHLKDLSQLHNLFLRGTRVTGTGLVHLRSFTMLQSLGLAGTPVTDAGLVHLKGLAGLERLLLNNTQVTDAGLAHLSGLAGLQKLYLSDTQVTDAGLTHLKGLAGLQVLTLRNTPVTDAGLAHLKGLAGLQQLYLDDTRVTDAGPGVATLKKALPKCEIHGVWFRE